MFNDTIVPSKVEALNKLGTSRLGADDFATAQATVATTATLIVAARTGATGVGRVSVTITNMGTTPVFLGKSNVTAGTGTLLPGVLGASVTLEIKGAVYGIVASGTQAVSVIETF